jgi:hypothetical protein
VKAWTEVSSGDWLKGVAIVISGYPLGVHAHAAGIAHSNIAKISTNYGSSGAGWRLLDQSSTPIVGVHLAGNSKAGNLCCPITNADLPFLKGQMAGKA